MEEQVAEALNDLREVSRGLHPAVLSRLGLDAALRSLAARSAVPVHVEAEVPESVPQPVAIAVYYVVSEALANAAKHSGASLARVGVRRTGERLVATVADDGVGGAEADGGSGLLGLRDRVEALGGRLTVDSPRGEGTTIAAELSLVEPA
jgi:signal transduction histidine kinase